MRKRVLEPTQADAPPGAFRPDGSWNERGDFSDRGHMHALIRALATETRRCRLTPETAANAILASNATEAFPNHDQWHAAPEWPQAVTGTAAEEAVKRAGLHGGHHCNGFWKAGEEKDCTNPGHKLERDPAKAKALAQAALEKLSSERTLSSAAAIQTSWPNAEQDPPPEAA